MKVESEEENCGVVAARRRRSFVVGKTGKGSRVLLQFRE
jgi:hypothetical protein